MYSILITLLNRQISGQGIVDENDYQYIGYAICGRYWEPPCIGTLIHNKYLLTSAQCIKQGICGVAGLRAHDINKAIQVRIIRQFVLRPKKIGRSSFLTKNVGLLEILPPKLLDGTIPTARIAKENVSGLLENPKECESVRWNHYSGNLEYVAISEEADNDGHFMSCDELMEEEALNNPRDCRKTAIFKQTSEQTPDVCSSEHGIPLFCQGFLMGVFVNCRSVPSLFYENIVVNYLEFSLLQDQISWIDSVIRKNATTQITRNLPMKKREKPVQEFKKGTSKILEKYFSFNKKIDKVDSILNDKAIFQKGPNISKKPIKIGVNDRLKIQNGDFDLPTTTQEIEIFKNSTQSIQNGHQPKIGHQWQNVEFYQSENFEDTFPTTVNTANEISKTKISNMVSEKSETFFTTVLEIVKKEPTRSKHLILDPKSIEDIFSSREENFDSKNHTLENIKNENPERENESPKEMLDEEQIEYRKKIRKSPKSHKYETTSSFYEEIPEESEEIFEDSVPKKISLHQKEFGNKIPSDEYLLEEETFDEPEIIFPKKYSKKKFKNEEMKNIMRKYRKFRKRTPATFKTIKPLKFREIDENENADENEKIKMDGSSNVENVVSIQKKSEEIPECDSFWFCSGATKNLSNSKILYFVYFILFLSQYMIIFL